MNNLLLSNKICTFVMGRIPIYCIVFYSLIGGEILAQRKPTRDVFNTVNYLTQNPKVSVQYDSINRREKDDVSMTGQDSLKSCTDTIKQNVFNVSLPLKKIWITSPFGIRRDPINRKGRKMHNGLDLRANYEPVYSMLPGVVTKVSSSWKGGNYITLHHGMFVCSYLHLSQILVKHGQRIHAGQVVAISGNSGKRTTGPHLHITCRWGDEKGKYFNPLLLLNLVTEEMSN